MAKVLAVAGAASVAGSSTPDIDFGAINAVLVDAALDAFMDAPQAPASQPQDRSAEIDKLLGSDPLAHLLPPPVSAAKGTMRKMLEKAASAGIARHKNPAENFHGMLMSVNGMKLEEIDHETCKKIDAAAGVDHITSTHIGSVVDAGRYEFLKRIVLLPLSFFPFHRMITSGLNASGAASVDVIFESHRYDFSGIGPQPETDSRQGVHESFSRKRVLDSRRALAVAVTQVDVAAVAVGAERDDADGRRSLEVVDVEIDVSHARRQEILVRLSLVHHDPGTVAGPQARECVVRAKPCVLVPGFVAVFRGDDFSP